MAPTCISAVETFSLSIEEGKTGIEGMYVSAGTSRNGVSRTRPGDMHVLSSEEFVAFKHHVQLEGQGFCGVIAISAHDEKLPLKREVNGIDIVRKYSLWWRISVRFLPRRRSPCEGEGPS